MAINEAELSGYGKTRGRVWRAANEETPAAELLHKTCSVLDEARKLMKYPFPEGNFSRNGANFRIHWTAKEADVIVTCFPDKSFVYHRGKGQSARGILTPETLAACLDWFCEQRELAPWPADAEAVLLSP